MVLRSRHRIAPLRLRFLARYRVCDGRRPLSARNRWTVDARGAARRRRQSGPPPIRLRLPRSILNGGRDLPVFERRDAMLYRVYSATLAPGRPGPPTTTIRWRVDQRPTRSGLTTNLTADGSRCDERSRKGSYCVIVRTGPTRRGEVCTGSMLTARLMAAVRRRAEREPLVWLPATVTQFEAGTRPALRNRRRPASKEQCSLVGFNDHPEAMASRVRRSLRGMCEPTDAACWGVARRCCSGPRTAVLAMARAGGRRGGWADGVWKPGPGSPDIGVSAAAGLLNRVARRLPSSGPSNGAGAARAQMRALTPLRDLGDFAPIPQRSPAATTSTSTAAAISS